MKTLQRCGLVACGVLLVGLLAHAVFGAVTPNSVVLPQTPKCTTIQIATGDQTTPASLLAAGANGSKILDVLVYPDTDGTSGDREVTLYIHNGSDARQLVLIDVAGDSTADVVPESMFENLTLPIDSNGNKFLEIPSGYSLYISAESTTATNPVHVLHQDY